MKNLKGLNREKYRAALEDIKAVNELGLEIKFKSVIKKHELHPATKSSLVPNLAGVDLTKDFESLYSIQVDFLSKLTDETRARAARAYKSSKERMAALEEENARLRAKLNKKR